MQCDNYVRFVPAWGVVSFDVCVVGDMPGSYEDELVLVMNGEGGDRLFTTSFALSTTISGTPLEFDDTVVGMQVCSASLCT